MGKVECFTIKLKKPDPVYRSGDALAGNVLIRVKERLKINSVKMAITGTARVHWTESSGTGKGRHTSHHSAIENYLSFQMIFVSKPPNQDLYLESGDYSYPFQVYLPPNLPTSFEHTYGRVRYSIHGTIDIPWALDKHCNRSFSVISDLDLNVSPQLRQPYAVSDTKIVCCGICKSDPITANFTLMKGGYVPGEGIVFNASIDNKSGRTIREMTVRLLQNLRFHATTKSKSCTRTVAAIQFPGKIGPRSQDTWNSSVLTIPPVCSSSNGTCRIIEVSYLVEMSFDTSGIAISKDLRIPIIIGTVPLTAKATQDAYPLLDGDEEAAAPSYEECLFSASASSRPRPKDHMPADYEAKGELVESDQATFKPYYPYYRNMTPS